MRHTLPSASERRVCRVLGLSRSVVRPGPGRPARAPRLDGELVTRLQALIQTHPTFGYRRLWALLRFREGRRLTPKTVYRVLALKG